MSRSRIRDNMAVMLALVLALLVAPPSAPSSSYEVARGNLDQSLDVARNGTSEEAIEALTAALDELQQFPVELATDDDALAQRDLALFALAFVHFTLDDEQGAAQAMDAAIRTVRTRKVPLHYFGPDFGSLHADRLAALTAGGTANIVVECSDCVVFIDEAPSPTASEPLLLGSYRVHVVAGDEATSVPVTLAAAGTTETVALLRSAEPPAPQIDSPDQASTEGSLAPSSPTRTGADAGGRTLPRWAEITGIAVGAAALIAGGVILSFNGRCPGGLDPVADRAECSKVYNAQPAGYTLIAAGAATVVSFGALITVDEVRTRRSRGPQVMLHYTLRF
jgi:hypothetical protein